MLASCIYEIMCFNGISGYFIVEMIIGHRLNMIPDIENKSIENNFIQRNMFYLPSKKILDKD